jgi:hypothetical protein
VNAYLQRILYRHPRALWLLTLLSVVVAGLLTVSCLSLAFGCGQGQRIVSAMASAAVAADSLNAAAYEIQAAEAVDRVKAHGGDFSDWCEIMQGPWDRASTAECAIESLASLALAGQHVLDAGDDLDAEWAGAACSTLDAITDAWTAAEDPPAVLSTARSLVCGMADGGRSDGPTCREPGPPPPCGEGLKCAREARAVAAVWAALGVTP